MAGDTTSKPSFSPLRKFGIALNLLVRTAVVLALVVMTNYLSGRYFNRFYFSSQTRIELSPRTVSLLKSLTNDVQVTLYYDKDDPVFTTVTGLLNEYRAVNRRITVRVVDYYREPAEAQKVKSDYKAWFSNIPGRDKDLVIFSCEGRVRSCPGEGLTKYGYGPMRMVDGKPEVDRKPVAFNGEVAFTSMLLAVTDPKPRKACYLIGHIERNFDDAENEDGFATFKAILQQDYIQPEPLSLLGTNGVPKDCDLLIIAGPATPLTEGELERIDQYLGQGGRLFALFDYRSRERPTGLEKILGDWGVAVGTNFVRDPETARTASLVDVVVSDFAQQHPVVNPLLRSRLNLSVPRPVGRLNVSTSSADAPRVDELMFTSAGAFLDGDPERKPARFPLAVAVEKGAVPGVATERGTTRIVVVGDSLFLGNTQIESVDNRYFVSYAANWLLNRIELVQGPGPRPVTEYRLTLTRSQQRVIRWLLLAALPGAVLLFGGLVWLRRRK